MQLDYTHDIASRFRIAYIVAAIFFGLLLGRLYILQIIHGDNYRHFSEGVSVRALRVPAPRGTILDRSGAILASHRPTLDLVVVPQYVVNWEATRSSISRLTGMDEEAIESAWRRRKASYRPILIKSNVDMDTVSRIRANKTPWFLPEDPFDLRGVEIEPRSARAYSDGTLAPHVLGYLKEVDEKEFSRLEKKHPGYYALRDRVGAVGVEAAMDVWLKGRDGRHPVIVNAMGREVDYPGLKRDLADESPVPGETVQTTLDSRLQTVARDQLRGRRGAVVALDPRNGEILALASSPGFDLMRLQGSDRQTYWAEITSREERVLFNRAIQAMYPPGSTYKMVTALAGLTEGVIHPDESVTCHGGMEIGGRRFSCWNKSGHGAVSLRAALAGSCDVYFYTVGLRLGPDVLARYARLLGLGAVTGLDIPGEKPGLVPTPAWKQERFSRPWAAGETASVAIGQGALLLTPLQLATMVSHLVSGPVTPHLVKKQTSPLPRGEGQGEGASFNPTHLSEIRQGMEAVVNSPGGTARHLASLNLKIAGKTGTAQTVGYDSGVKKGDHAWFVGYAPYDDPKMVVAVILEFAGHGGSEAAPVAGELFKTYLGASRDP